MVKDIYDKILNGIEVRKNLIALKQELGEEKQKREFAYMLEGDYSRLLPFLKHEDPKVRKNTALILGMLEDEDLKEVLLSAYEEETQEFVKSSYLKAMEHYDYQEFLPALQNRLKYLEGEVPATESQKHWKEELTILRRMVFRYERPKTHPFCGMKEESEVILLTNRNHREATKEQLPETEDLKMLAGGLKFKTSQLDRILPIRTYSEILFPVQRTALLSPDPREAAAQLAKSDLLPFLERMHDGRPPFYYRIEVKSRMSLEERAQFLKKLTTQLDFFSDGKLRNLPSGYEVEIRMVENKAGRFIPLLKLYTLKDRRFAYRKQTIAASISPVNAALFMQLAKDYLKEGAQVLDPFCGVGTMLLERSFLNKTGDMYGIDLYEEAILKGRENARIAERTIHFINRNFFDFHHEYLFDEIISNLPGITPSKGRDEIHNLYECFFGTAAEVLVDGGVLLLYSTEPDLLLHCLRRTGQFSLLKQWKIQDKTESVLFVIQKRGTA